jgi:hypothetical protein
LVDETIGVTWRWPAPDLPGVYRVERDGVTVFAMAVKVPGEESRLESLSPDVLTRRLAAGHAVACRDVAEDGQRREDFWKWLAVACIVCLLGETSALLIFRA